MAEQEFRVAYEGPRVADGRMDVRQLAPALLSLADLFREASRITHPNLPPVSMDIRATERGSFDVSLLLSQIDSTIVYAASETLKELLKAVVGGNGVQGLMTLLVLIQGNRIVRREQSRPGLVRITTAEGVMLEVPADVMQLHDSPLVRRSAREVVRPLEAPGVDALRVQSADVSVQIEQGDVHAFDVPDLPEEELLNIQIELNLRIVSVAFAEDNKWRFSDGQTTFWATIDDSYFLNRVETGEEAFRNGDTLRCMLRIRQTRNADGALKSDRSVVTVLDHIPQTMPTRLFSDSENDTE